MSENSGPVIYVGPAYKDTEIHTNQIFADGIPAKYKDTQYISICSSQRASWMRHKKKLNLQAR